MRFLSVVGYVTVLLKFLTTCRAHPQIQLETGSYKNYTDHLLLSVRVNGSDDSLMETLAHLQEEMDVDFWDEPVSGGTALNVRASPEVGEQLERFFSNKSLTFEVLTRDLQTWIDEEQTLNTLGVVPRNGNLNDFDLYRYHSLEEIETYLSSLATRYANECKLVSIGETAEGRDIWLIKLTKESDRRKPIVWIDAGIHAREWIAPSTALFVIHRLAEPTARDEDAERFLDQFDWYIVPVLNPDGYVHSWRKDRFWRKNRSTPRTRPFRYPWTVFSDCVGTDLNRNFDISFGGSGTSGNPCSNAFRGDEPFSEQETRAVKRALREIKANLKVYLTLHSYSQMWMMPYAHTLQHSPDYAQQMEVLKDVVSAVKSKHGETYSYGPMSSLLYSAAGASPDWVYKELGVKNSFLVELRDRGRRGFLLPPDQIVPSGEELWEALKVLTRVS